MKSYHPGSMIIVLLKLYIILRTCYYQHLYSTKLDEQNFDKLIVSFISEENFDKLLAIRKSFSLLNFCTIQYFMWLP